MRERFPGEDWATQRKPRIEQWEKEYAKQQRDESAALPTSPEMKVADGSATGPTLGPLVTSFRGRRGSREASLNDTFDWRDLEQAFDELTDQERFILISALHVFEAKAAKVGSLRALAEYCRSYETFARQVEAVQAMMERRVAEAVRPLTERFAHRNGRHLCP
jgi:hypothetical protein